MIKALSKVTSSQLKFLTSPTRAEKFKGDLVLCGLAKPPKGCYVVGVQSLTNAKAVEVKPAQIKINEELNPRDENDLTKVAVAIKQYLTKNPNFVLVIDSDYKYIDAIPYLDQNLQERIIIVEYKPIATPAPAWVQATLGIFS